MSYSSAVSAAEARKADAFAEMERVHRDIEQAGPNADLRDLEQRFKDATARHKRAKEDVAVAEARASLPVAPTEDTVPGAATSFGARSKGPHVRVSREPLTYERHAQSRSFFRDIYAAKQGDPDAQQALSRHNREMEVEGRALSSTDTAGGDFVPPIWITDEWVNVARPQRAVADTFRSLPLPPAGDSVNLPAVSTGATVATQQDGGSVSSTDPVTAAITAEVVTIAGQVDLSRQSFERSAPGLDMVLGEDLYKAYAAKIESQVISGAGSGGEARGLLNVSGANSITWTQTTPTVATMYSKVGDAVQRIAAATYDPCTHIAMSARRFQWLASAVDTAGRPLLTPVGPQNTLGSYQAPVGTGPAGTLQGVPVYISGGIPLTSGAGTNEDRVVCYRGDECYLWESPNGPTVRVHEDVLSGTGQLRIQIWGYAAVMPHRRPTSVSILSGTGLVSPSW